MKNNILIQNIIIIFVALLCSCKGRTSNKRTYSSSKSLNSESEQSSTNNDITNEDLINMLRNIEGELVNHALAQDPVHWKRLFAKVDGMESMVNSGNFSQLLDYSANARLSTMRLICLFLAIRAYYCHGINDNELKMLTLRHCFDENYDVSMIASLHGARLTGMLEGLDKLMNLLLIEETCSGVRGSTSLRVSQESAYALKELIEDAQLQEILEEFIKQDYRTDHIKRNNILREIFDRYNTIRGGLKYIKGDKRFMVTIK